MALKPRFSIITITFNAANVIEPTLKSVLSQTYTNYEYLLIDGGSKDDTVAKAKASGIEFAHIVSERDNGLYDAMNKGIALATGDYLCFLNAGDAFHEPDTLQKIVDAFALQKCAMVVGTYQMTDFQMNPIPPGIIDHKEWTEDNGRNNALRVNGLGAPRAFWTPLLRRLNLPNTSYGEDYALGLRISRDYRIGRIYDVLYCCRRWDGNSDAALDIEKVNANNLYKDRIRTWELEARIRMNK